jgi:hypothetical protein
MSRTLLTLVITCCADRYAAAEDHLAPCDSQEYEQRVEAIAQATMPGAPELWVTVFPSFTPEWSVSVSTVEGRHLLTHVIFDRSFWYSSWVATGPDTAINDPSKGRARAKAKTTNVSVELYDALRAEWERSIKNARPSESETIIVDGVRYAFRLPGQCASAWSPDSETRNGKLVDLVSNLARLADTQKSTPVARNEGSVLTKLHELPPTTD